jgi:hypothetical protein
VPSGRGGEKAKEDFRREMGNVMYAFEKLMSKPQPVINAGNRPIEDDAKVGGR